MKNIIYYLTIIIVIAITGLAFTACQEPRSETPSVSFNGVTANGSSSQTTTQLTLNFSQAITGLNANNINLSGVSNVTKGTLSGSGPTYTLPISGFTEGGTLSVSVVKSGFNISGSTKTVTITYVAPSGNTSVTLTFAQISDIPDITGPTISISGSEKTATITLDNPTQYSDIRWQITGTTVTQTGGSSFTLTTVGSVYKIQGQHFLTVEVTKAGKPYNKTIVFTVAP